MTTITLGGDVMLGRLVATSMREEDPSLVWGDLLPVLRASDLLFVNLECALTSHAQEWHDGRGKTFYFRAPPRAVRALAAAEVDLVTLANNHVLDFGAAGLDETLRTLDRAGIAHAGAGPDDLSAAAPARVRSGPLRVSVVSFADHPAEWAAAPARPGIALLRTDEPFVDLAPVRASLRRAREGADVVVLALHWGPNMCDRPSPRFRQIAHDAVDAGADIVWGHSAHVVQGVELYRGRPIVYDSGDLLDDYAVDPELRNDLGALFRVRIADGRFDGVEVVPVLIADMRAWVARGDARADFVVRFRTLCDELGTAVEEEGDRLLLIRAPVAAR